MVVDERIADADFRGAKGKVPSLKWISQHFGISWDDSGK